MRHRQALLFAAVLTVTVGTVPAEAAARHMVTVSGPRWTCTDTAPEYMIHAGGANLAVEPGHVSFSVAVAASGTMQDPYLTAGYEGDLNSELCNGRKIHGAGDKHGRSFALPQRIGRQGHPVSTVHDWTSASFRGDAGFDLWFTKSRSDHTYCQMADGGAGSTELMIWLSHPRLGHYRYYHVHIDGRWWMVTTGLAAHGHGRGPGHPKGWNVVNFIAPQVSEGNVSVHNLSIDQFMSYAINHGWLDPQDYLMSVNQGFEAWRGTAVVRSYAMTGLK